MWCLRVGLGSVRDFQLRKALALLFFCQPLTQRPRKFRTHVLCLSAATLCLLNASCWGWPGGIWLLFKQFGHRESWPNPSSGIVNAVSRCSLSGLRQGIADLLGSVLNLSVYSALFPITLSSLLWIRYNNIPNMQEPKMLIHILPKVELNKTEQS